MNQRESTSTPELEQRAYLQVKRARENNFEDFVDVD
jgi:hypothetical protein